MSAATATKTKPSNQTKKQASLVEFTTQADLHAAGKMLIVDEKLHACVGELSKEERDGLEERLVRDGCRDPISYWIDPEQPKNAIILDGRNRYEICTRLDIPYRLCEVEAADRVEAEIWILQTSESRRNLTEQMRARIIGRRKNLESLKWGGDRKTDGSSCHIGNLKSAADKTADKTAEKIAKETGVSPRSVMRYGKYAEAVDAIEATEPDAAKAILAGKVKSTKADVQRLAALPDEPLMKATELIAQEKVSSVKEAMEEAARDASASDEDEIEREPGDDGDDPTIEDYIEQLAEMPKRIVKELNRIGKELRERAESKDRDLSYHFQAAWTTIRECLTTLKRHVDLNTPHAPCVHCHGERCKKCDQLGFLTKFGFDSLSEDMKAKAKAG